MNTENWTWVEKNITSLEKKWNYSRSHHLLNGVLSECNKSLISTCNVLYKKYRKQTKNRRFDVYWIFQKEFQISMFKLWSDFNKRYSQRIQNIWAATVEFRINLVKRVQNMAWVIHAFLSVHDLQLLPDWPHARWVSRQARIVFSESYRFRTDSDNVAQRFRLLRFDLHTVVLLSATGENHPGEWENQSDKEVAGNFSGGEAYSRRWNIEHRFQNSNNQFRHVGFVVHDHIQRQTKFDSFVHRVQHHLYDDSDGFAIRYYRKRDP